MTYALAFWIGMGLFILFNLASPKIENVQYRSWGNTLLLAFLLVLLGLATFGKALHP